MKHVIIILALSLSNFVLAQTSSENYLQQYGIQENRINKLTFKHKTAFSSFISEFEDKKGFELPKFLILDNTGQLLKHKLDVIIKSCGKGDVKELKKKYFKKSPSLDQLNTYFNEELLTPEQHGFIVIFIWHQVADQYNKHTFETFHTWKDQDFIKIYFLNLSYE